MSRPVEAFLDHIPESGVFEGRSDALLVVELFVYGFFCGVASGREQHVDLEAGGQGVLQLDSDLESERSAWREWAGVGASGQRSVEFNTYAEPDERRH